MPIRFNLYDIAYYLGVGVASPYWLIKSSARTKVLRAFRERMGHVPARADSSRPAVLIHAVSLGEINATRALVDMLRRRRDDLHIIISTTTDTGFARGQQLYGANPNVTLIRYPLDFSPAIHRVLDALRPGVVVLMELELWPNFVRACKQRGIAVILANGRLTEESFGRYLLVRPIVAAMLRRVDRLCVQDDLYGQRFLRLGARPDQVTVIGTMKFDTATIAERVEGDEQLAREVGLRPRDEPIWVCGSTGPGEEEILLRVYQSLREKHSSLRLVLVPRKPERFDDVAQLIESQGFALTRRSKPETAPEDSVVLGDTMGELQKIYSLASVVFVGRSLVDLGPRQHGSDMIEPCALGKATLIGPFTGNFADVVRSFKAGNSIVEVPDEATLRATLSALLRNPDEARALGARAREVVRAQKGATERHADVVLAALSKRT
ncbi:MAG: 3-deoxy-D-manno-octulosonic acid transferase [Anaerolineae bacterium]|nr:3-deoxy-D-manno-octulosonic acid transferase [Phycisphaerae bacterium]